jgi:hypothetical protein
MNGESVKWKLFRNLENERWVAVENLFRNKNCPWQSCNYAHHFPHLQVGGDNPKIEGGILQNQYAKQSRILLSL